MRAPFACILLILLAGTLSAVGSSSALPLADNSALFMPNWFSTAIIAVSLSIGLVALCFMAGQAFNIASVQSFARQELYELVVTVLLLTLVVGSLFAFGVFARNVAGSTLTSGTPIISGYCQDSASIYPVPSTTNPENALYADVDWFLGCMPTGEHGKYDDLESSNTPVYDPDSVSPYAATQWAQGASKGILAANLMNIYIGLFSLEFMLGPISTLGMSAYLPEPIVSSISLDMAPHAALSPISEVTITITDLIGVGLSAIIMQKILLQFVHQNALVVFLPLGLAFRAIPFLRKTGSTIIALVLVMYFIFPISIWLNQQVYFNLQGGIDPQTGRYAHPVISDWTNYHMLLQSCVPQNAAEQADPSLVVARAQAEMQAYLTQSQSVEEVLREDVYGNATTSDGSTVEVYLPISQSQEIQNSLERNGLLVVEYLLKPSFALGPSLPVDFFYSALVDQITVSSQWFVLNMLFLINSILISITLFRDFSLAIGGEPRIFGLSKLV